MVHWYITDRSCADILVGFLTLFACCCVDFPPLQRTIETKQYNLESAEGCYSMAVMYSKDIKAKYAVKVRNLGRSVQEYVIMVEIMVAFLTATESAWCLSPA